MSEGVLGLMFDIKEFSSATDCTSSTSDSGAKGSKRSRDDVYSHSQAMSTSSMDDTSQQPHAQASQNDSSTPTVVTAPSAKPKQKKRVGGISLNPSARKKR